MVSYAWYLSWNLYHMFIYQCNMVKIFLGIFTRFKRIFQNISMCFFSQVLTQTWLSGQAGRPSGRPNHGPVDRCGRPTCTALCTSGRHRASRPAGRPDQRALLSVSGRSTGRSTGPESLLSVSGRSTGFPQRSYFWPLAVDRAGRPQACQAARSA